MDGGARFDELLGLIYEASTEPALWKEFLECFSDAIHSSGTVLFVHDFANCNSTALDSPDHSFVAHARADEAYIKSFQTYYNQVNVWLDTAKQYGEGVPVISSALYPDADLPKTEFFHGWLAPQNYFYSIGGSILQRGDVSVRLTALRPQSAGVYEQDEIDLYLRLIPHLQRALRIHWRLVNESGARNLCETALERMGQAVALLDGAGRVLFANSMAEAHFRTGGGLVVTSDYLGARQKSDATKVREGMRRAREGIGNSMTFTDVHTGRKWVVTFMPLTTQAGSDGARVMAFIADPERPAVGLKGFAKQYGITPAEVRLLEQLLTRESIKEIAETLGVSINTVRTQLSSLFSKTQTRNQRELIRILLSHPLMLLEQEAPVLKEKRSIRPD